MFLAENRFSVFACYSVKRLVHKAPRGGIRICGLLRLAVRMRHESLKSSMLLKGSYWGHPAENIFSY